MSQIWETKSISPYFKVLSCPTGVNLQRDFSFDTEIKTPLSLSHLFQAIFNVKVGKATRWSPVWWFSSCGPGTPQHLVTWGLASNCKFSGLPLETLRDGGEACVLRSTSRQFRGRLKFCGQPARVKPCTSRTSPEHCVTVVGPQAPVSCCSGSDRSICHTGLRERSNGALSKRPLSKAKPAWAVLSHRSGVLASGTVLPQEVIFIGA